MKIELVPKLAVDPELAPDGVEMEKMKSADGEESSGARPVTLRKLTRRPAQQLVCRLAGACLQVVGEERGEV